MVFRDTLHAVHHVEAPLLHESSLDESPANDFVALENSNLTIFIPDDVAELVRKYGVSLQGERRLEYAHVLGGDVRSRKTLAIKFDRAYSVDT